MGWETRAALRYAANMEHPGVHSTAVDKKIRPASTAQGTSAQMKIASLDDPSRRSCGQ